jgi:hypothetical protein
MLENWGLATQFMAPRVMLSSVEQISKEVVVELVLSVSTGQE